MLLGQNRADEADQSGAVGEDPDHVHHRVWVPNLGSPHATVLILAEQSAESVAPSDATDLACCAVRDMGKRLAEGAARPMAVVVAF